MKGAPETIGRTYGEACRDGILANLKPLVYRDFVNAANAS